MVPSPVLRCRGVVKFFPGETDYSMVSNRGKEIGALMEQSPLLEGDVSTLNT